MSQDGKPQTISRKPLVNDRPIKNQFDCECGGVVYAAPSSRYAVCSSGETRCTKCRRECRKFQRNWTCGVGCRPYGE